MAIPTSPLATWRLSLKSTVQAVFCVAIVCSSIQQALAQEVAVEFELVSSSGLELVHDVYFTGVDSLSSSTLTICTDPGSATITGFTAATNAGVSGLGQLTGGDVVHLTSAENGIGFPLGARFKIGTLTSLRATADVELFVMNVKETEFTGPDPDFVIYQLADSTQFVGTSSLFTAQELPQFQVAPTVAHNSARLLTTKPAAYVSIYGLSGAATSRLRVEDNTFSVSDLPAGSYILHVEDLEGTVLGAARILVQH